MHGDSTIMDRVNPGYVRRYVCEDERNQEYPTVFLIKNLNVWEYKFAEELLTEKGTGSFNLFVVESSIVGWENFLLTENETIPYSLNNISHIPVNYLNEISNEIWNSAEVDKDLEYELVMVARWQDYFSKLDERKASEWNCEYCIEKGLQKRRNCYGDEENVCMNNKCGYTGPETKCPKCGDKMRPPFRLVLNKNLGIAVSRCPLSILTSRAVKLSNLVSYTESSHSLPFGSSAFEQTNFFYAARTILLGEQNTLLKAEYANIRADNKQNKHGSGRHGSKASPNFIPKS